MNSKEVFSLVDNDYLDFVLEDIFRCTDTDPNELSDEAYATLIAAVVTYGQCVLLEDRQNQVDELINKLYK